MNIMDDKKKIVYGVELKEDEELFEGFEEEVNNGKGGDEDE